MLAGLTGLLSQRSCTEMLLPRVMRLLEDNAYLVRKVRHGYSVVGLTGHPATCGPIFMISVGA